MIAGHKLPYRCNLECGMCLFWRREDEDHVWDVDIRKLWNTFEWAPYEKCNACALACYLEPSRFRWTNPAMIRQRILDPIVAYLDWNSVEQTPVPAGTRT